MPEKWNNISTEKEILKICFLVGARCTFTVIIIIIINCVSLIIMICAELHFYELFLCNVVSFSGCYLNLKF